MRGRLLVLALMVNSCAPTIAPVPPPCTETRRVAHRKLAPNLMFVIDRSIATPQLSELTHALQVLITRQPTFARYGIAVFPHDAACGASDQTNVLLHLPDAGSEDPDFELRAQSDEAVFQLSSITQLGQPSTADSLRFIGSLPELHDARRPSLLLLVTQGVPGCEADGGYAEALAALEELASQDVRTSVLPFEADLSDSGTIAAFDALAAAGHFARGCFLGDQDCALPFPGDGGADGGFCNLTTHLCEPAFFAPTNADELEIATVLPLLPISGTDVQDPCAFFLKWSSAAASDLSVYIDGSAVQQCDGGVDCWTYDMASGTPKVILEGDLCQQLMHATESHPVELAFVVPSCDR